MFSLFKSKKVAKAVEVAKEVADTKISMYEKQNAKALSERYMSPFQFVERVIIPVIEANKSANMVNRDAFRQKNNETALQDLKKEIRYSYADKLYNFKDYYKETPYNRMLMWGALLMSLKEIFLKEKSKTEIKEINATEYKKLPKRYRGAFRRSAYNPNSYVCEQKKDNKLFELVYNAEHPNYKLLNKDINNLLAKLYEKEIVSRTFTPERVGIDEYGNRSWVTKIEYDYGITPKTGLNLSNRISDEKMEAMAQLQDYFVKIASMCVVIKPKYGQQEIFNELNAENKQKNILVKAQKLTKATENMIDVVRESNDVCMFEQEERAMVFASRLREDVLLSLRYQFSSRVK